MKIQFKQGTILAIDGVDTPSTPTGKLLYAAEWLSRFHSLDANFSGMIDTERGGIVTVTVPLDLEPVADAAMVPTAGKPAIQRYSASMGPAGPFNAPDYVGGFVLYADYERLQAENQRLTKELAEVKSIATDRADEIKKLIAADTAFRAGLAKAIGLTLGWGAAKPTQESLLERIAELIEAAKLEHDELMFARDFRVQVLNLINLTAGHSTDHVFKTIQTMAAAEITCRRKLEMILFPGWRDDNSPRSFDWLIEQVGNMVFENKKLTAEVAKLNETTTIKVDASDAVAEMRALTAELNEPVGRAVFECTFEWARENWDLFVDKFVWGTVNNPASTESGYIKVVTTGN